LPRAVRWLWRLRRPLRRLRRSHRLLQLSSPLPPRFLG
jgi:hypothetical protein